MADPYTILGVQKSADEKAIKSAFRKLAKKYHPDQNQQDKNAQARFAQVNQAYEILGDSKKRAQYDRGEIDGTGKPKFSGFGGMGGAGMGDAGMGGAGSDPFSQFRQSGGRSRGHSQDPFGGAEDILNELFGSAFGGATGRGNFGGGTGPNGGFGGGPNSGFGQGQTQGGPNKAKQALNIELSSTIGIDELLRGKANVTLPDGKRITFSVPPEAEDGQVVRLKGKGKSARGLGTGDVLITLKIFMGRKFQRDGADLRLDFPLDLEVAVKGGKAQIETPDGKLSLKIPAGTNSGKIFRLKGKGLPQKGGGHGDLLVNMMIQLPEYGLEALQSFFER